ncbi:MAG: HTH domain-containing protein [Bacteroidales bacterium]|nr:HTH domain-containing protein [Candidatus Colicola coprequi]
MIRQTPTITRTKLAELLSVSPAAIQKAIDKLKKQGILVRKGGDFGGHWEIINNQSNNMKKLFLFIAALTLCVGLWANELEDAKAAAIEEIELAIVGVTDTDILGVATTAETQIGEAATEEAINSIKTFALTKINALVLIQTARQGIQNTEINLWIDGAFNDILRGGPTATPGIDEIREKIMTVITSVQIGKEEGQAEVLGAMGTPCTGCTAVEVTDGTTTVTLYNATNVGYIKK